MARPNGGSVNNLWDAFAAGVERRPDSTALVLPNREVTFLQLMEYAGGCAGFLHECGVGPGDIVALQLPKRLETYALMLGCLRIGAPYVCIDPNNPGDRTRRIVERVRPSIMFTTAGAENGGRRTVQFTSIQAGHAWLEERLSRGRTDPPRHSITGTDPAYIMFTSGSTGEPKGAVIPHQGVLSLMSWCRDNICTPEEQRFTNINPLHFDNSVFDFYCGLVNGAALVPIETSEMTNPATWVRRIRESCATVAFAVPTLFLILDRLSLLTPQALPAVQTFVFGGEGFPIGKLREFFQRFKGRAKLVNVYGPTETSCICASLVLDEAALDAPDTSFPPLGRMHANFSFMIIDDEGRLARNGDVGELLIGGPCVGLGYYANPEETATRFVQQPHQNSYRSVYYRSGDLVREDGDGRLWFHGRADNQIKIRGHRIELEEIDLAVQSVPGVGRALTVVLDEPDERFLAVALIADRDVPSEEIIEACRRRLPAYMVPKLVRQLDNLPYNANGKVDRRAVLAVFQQQWNPAAGPCTERPQPAARIA